MHTNIDCKCDSKCLICSCMKSPTFSNFVADDKLKDVYVLDNIKDFPFYSWIEIFFYEKDKTYAVVISFEFDNFIIELEKNCDKDTNLNEFLGDLELNPITLHKNGWIVSIDHSNFDSDEIKSVLTKIFS